MRPRRGRALGAGRGCAGRVKGSEGVRGLAGFNLPTAVRDGLDLNFQDPGITEIQSVIEVFESDQFDESSQLFTVIVDHNVFHTETVLQGITT